MATPRNSPRSPSSPTSPRQTHQKTVPWDAEIDSDALFSSHTIDEIRALENKTRSDIENKKEELRLMVGERYRDLIDAADTITEMKYCAQKVNDTIDDIQKQYKDLYQSHRCHGVGGVTQPTKGPTQSKSGFYSLASQMKLLVDTPEKVWSALERQQYMKATQLYLLSHHIVSILHLETGSKAAPKVLSSFPILQRQWAAISHFKESILQGSRALLKDATQTDEATADALCSILLLEESSPRQVFSEFLLARKSALQEIFHPSQHATSIKSQICEVVRVIRTSLYQIYTLFMYGLDGNSEIHEIKDNPSLLFQVLYKVTRRERSDPNSDEEALEGLFGPDFDLVTSARYLPKTVLGYRPHMRSFPATIPLRNIQANCEEWINMCLRDVSSGVAKLLKYIGTLKGLATIRDAIWNLLKEAAAAQASSDGLTWEDLCRTVLNKDMCLWDTFLRPLFSERAKTILRGLFNATVSSSKNMVTKSMDDLSDYHHTDPMVRWDRDLAGYVWHESANDGPLSILSVGNNATKDKDGGGLTLKSLACTPSIVSLCSSINDKLSVILEDAQYLIADPKPDNASPATPKQSIFVPPGTPRQSSFAQNEAGHQSPFDRYKDSSKIQTFLQDACFTAFNELLAFIDQLFTEHKSKLESDTSLCYDTTCIDRVLFMGRLCRAVPTQCTHLKHVMQGVVTQTESTPSRGTPRLTRSSSVARRKLEVPGKMSELSELLLNRYLGAFRIWIGWASDVFLSSYEESLLHGDAVSALYSITSWEELKIEEESESGQQVQSTIRVPMQVSTYITSLLFSLCQELNRIGAHALDRRLLQELVNILSERVLRLYERFTEKHRTSLAQNRALQAIFDVKFVTSILAGRTEDEKVRVTPNFSDRLQTVVDTLEGFVDPFDLDVFSPHITRNLTRQLQRCGVLFGILVTLDKHTNHSFGVTSRSTSGSQDQHNIMPLAPNPPRFSLLPLTSHHGGSTYSSAEDSYDIRKKTSDVYKPTTPLVGLTAFHRHHQFFNSEQRRLQELQAS
ncbi:conserved oligomeric Golgi complex subunit 1 isoform X2 [Nematostella vectensis]|uniref:conserved oligomeric Golgi complex subunit 1 isoform X2 n=1 Tax=Nematostella vectensis TaxID=45351 RepID=UPI001390374F|nr:conserved oligomeric Golgi complex subunit 1 isoform X2 [Nematostella vectensis]